MARQFVLRREAPDAGPRHSIDYASRLNEQQCAAATAGAGAFLVVAGAGTGKTRTLVYRVAYLVETGVPAEGIVLLTFTRRAAREMLDRAADLLDGRCSGVRGGTFHRFCLGLLRKHASVIGFQDGFTILDSGDAADVIDVLRARVFSGSSMRAPRKEAIRAMFSASVNRRLSLEAVVEARHVRYVPLLPQLRQLRAAYADYKRRHNQMDYDDLLVNTLVLFDRHPSIGAQISGRCFHVLVDEYQDTNHLQAVLVEGFASEHGNVMAVGDDAQSIYRFRGADYRNILAFPDRFEGTTIVKLEQNYRSTQPILDLANHVLGQAATGYGKELYTKAKPKGEAPALVLTRSPDDESRFVAQQVLDLREMGVSLDQIGVLFRAGSNSFELEIELDRRNIPYVKRGGVRLLEAAHIRDFLAYLKVLENGRDAASWFRLARVCGHGSVKARRMAEAMSDIGPAKVKVSPRMSTLVGALRHAGRPDVPLAAQVEAILQHYEPVCLRRYDNAGKRWEEVMHFAGIACTHGSRRDFLSALALDPIDDVQRHDREADRDEPPLVLSTIHSAKGLEFRHVFIIRALDGVMPSSFALSDQESLDEELRMLYVAITRAEEDLIISYPLHDERRGGMTEPSRFIADVPMALLERHVLRDGPDHTPATSP